MKIQTYLEDVYDEETGELTYATVNQCWKLLKKQYPDIYNLTFTNVSYFDKIHTFL